MILEKGTLIGPSSLILTPFGEPVSRSTDEGPGESVSDGGPEGIQKLADMERELVARAMRATGDNQTRAAELLGITRDQLRYRLKKSQN